MRPGMSCSEEDLGGAREAMVEVNDFSRSKDLVRASLAASSVFAAYLCRIRRARAIWVVRRSVGVGEVDEDGGGFDEGVEVAGGGAGGSRWLSS